MKPLVIVSVLCFAAGLVLIFTFCTGSTGLSVAFPASGSSIHLDITTKGLPALGGAALTLAGAVLLVFTWVVAVVSLFRRSPSALPHEDLP